MNNNAFTFFISGILKAWKRNEEPSRKIIILSLIGILVAFTSLFIPNTSKLHIMLEYSAPLVLAVSLLALLILVIKENDIQNQQIKQKMEAAEERMRDNPDKPVYAWELARTKLENFLDRNLDQSRSIFRLTISVMLCGFALVTFGIVKAYSDPNNFPVSIVSATSGIIISFIGGSFLLIFRSILAQSANYVAILERINAVGMAVQIVSTIPDSDEKTKIDTTASVAKALLSMYSFGSREDNDKV